MTQSSLPPSSGLPTWRWLYLVYLWLSVGFCGVAAISIAATHQDVESTLVTGAFLVFGAGGIAFARALPDQTQLKWWHWALGALLIMPVVLFLLSLSAET